MNTKTEKKFTAICEENGWRVIKNGKDVIENTALRYVQGGAEQLRGALSRVCLLPDEVKQLGRVHGEVLAFAQAEPVPNIGPDVLQLRRDLELRVRGANECDLPAKDVAQFFALLPLFLKR